MSQSLLQGLFWLGIIPSLRLFAGPELRHTGECYLGDDKNNNGEKLSDYSLVDILLRYRPTNHKYKLSAFVGVENLFNEEYSTLGYEDWLENPEYNVYYPLPGRSFRAGLSFIF